MKKEAYNRFAARFRIALDRSGMTQRQLAEAANVTEVSISRYVNGARVPHPTYILPRLADALGVSADWLIGRKNSPPVIEFDDAIKALEFSRNNVTANNEFARGVREGLEYAINTLVIMKGAKE